MKKTHSTPSELVLGIILKDAPLTGPEVSARCKELGYPNGKSTGAQLFNARVKGLIHKDASGRYTLAATPKDG